MVTGNVNFNVLKLCVIFRDDAKVVSETVGWHYGISQRECEEEHCYQWKYGRSKWKCF